MTSLDLGLINNHLFTLFFHSHAAKITIKLYFLSILSFFFSVCLLFLFSSSFFIIYKTVGLGKMTCTYVYLTQTSRESCSDSLSFEIYKTDSHHTDSAVRTVGPYIVLYKRAAGIVRKAFV